MPKITMEIKQVGNQLDKEIKALQSLDKESVEVGHFDSQGLHYSGYTYPELMYFHHTGSDPKGSVRVTPRHLIDVLFSRNVSLNDPRFKAAFNIWKSKPPSDLSNGELLSSIAKILVEEEKALFGDVSALGKATSNPTPLLDTGQLKDHTAYKTSIDGIVKVTS